MAKQHTYKVSGMHCASCEILVEKKLLEIDGIKSIDASTSNGQVVINYEGELPDLHKINNLFKKEGYFFSDVGSELGIGHKASEGKKVLNKTFLAFDIALFFIVVFLLLEKVGVGGLLNVGSESSLGAFFGFGLLAGFSSCAALVGGIVLSMSKQWSELYSEKQTTAQKLQPHLMFNIGRIISYGVFGAFLGAVGSQIKVSVGLTSFLIILISFVMMALALQMLGIKAFREFQFALPKSITRNIADEKKFSGKYMPFVMGALTFFLPCGFTITAQGLALLSGSLLQGGLIMAVFALGTAPALLIIGMSSVKFFSKPNYAETFSKVAGFLVLFFALFNINAQMNVLGFPGFGSLFTNNSDSMANQKDLPVIVNGKQIIKMNASASGYSPSYFKVRVGVPVIWEITDTGTSGCTNAVISKSLFSGSIPLTPGKVSVKEFTPEKAGKYKFSCWMGMVVGTIEVIN
jgi:sulfite exporter TauE/SafE/copper chaperone CopZ